MTPRLLVAARQPQDYTGPIAAAFPGLAVVGVDERDGAAHAAEAEIIVTIGRWLRSDLAARCRRLRWVQCLITGTDHLAPAMQARPDLVVTNARGIHGPQMSETALFHMLSLARGGTLLARMQAGRQSERIVPRLLRGRNVTILGIGSIAESLALLCKALGMQVHGVSRSSRAVAGFDRIFPREALREAVGLADFLVVLVPYSPETHHMVDASVLDAMKPDACLVNLSRGGIVDETALLEALRGRRIAGAGLDVFSEFPLPPQSPLWDLDNVVITPWIGGQSDRYAEAVMDILLPNLAAFLGGDTASMTNRVDAGAPQGRR